MHTTYINASILHHNHPPREGKIVKESWGLVDSNWKLGTGPAQLVKPGYVGMCPGLLRIGSSDRCVWAC